MPNEHETKYYLDLWQFELDHAGQDRVTGLAFIFLIKKYQDYTSVARSYGELAENIIKENLVNTPLKMLDRVNTAMKKKPPKEGGDFTALMHAYLTVYPLAGLSVYNEILRPANLDFNVPKIDITSLKFQAEQIQRINPELPKELKLELDKASSDLKKPDVKAYVAVLKKIKIWQLKKAGKKVIDPDAWDNSIVALRTLCAELTKDPQAAAVVEAAAADAKTAAAPPPTAAAATAAAGDTKSAAAPAPLPIIPPQTPQEKQKILKQLSSFLTPETRDVSYEKMYGSPLGDDKQWNDFKVELIELIKKAEQDKISGQEIGNKIAEGIKRFPYKAFDHWMNSNITYDPYYLSSKVGVLKKLQSYGIQHGLFLTSNEEKLVPDHKAEYDNTATPMQQLFGEQPKLEVKADSVELTFINAKIAWSLLVDFRANFIDLGDYANEERTKLTIPKQQWEAFVKSLPIKATIKNIGKLFKRQYGENYKYESITNGRLTFNFDKPPKKLELKNLNFQIEYKDNEIIVEWEDLDKFYQALQKMINPAADTQSALLKGPSSASPFNAAVASAAAAATGITSVAAATAGVAAAGAAMLSATTASATPKLHN